MALRSHGPQPLKHEAIGMLLAHDIRERRMHEQPGTGVVMTLGQEPFQQCQRFTRAMTYQNSVRGTNEFRELQLIG
jgi:hypothetical protein